MAYAALVSLAQVLDDILDQDLIILPDKQQIRSLHENIVFLVAFLEQFPDDVGILEERITTAASQAEDIVEFHISDEIRAEYTCCGVIYCVRQVVRCFQVALFSECQKGVEHLNWRKLHKYLQNVIKEISAIVVETKHIKAKTERKDLSTSHSGSTTPELTPRGKCIVMGFEEDLREIKGRLYDASPELQTIPIIGMGGIGKTTLARYAYDDSFALKHFDCCAWVTISQCFHQENVLLDILRSTTKQSKHQSQDIGLEVYRSLKGRRYLIVIDDMWDPKVWDSFRQIFPNESNGSRIIITSKELDVATYIDKSVHVHQINLMSVDQSWNLLRETVFGQEYNCPLEIEKIGKSIAQKCGGLPLAIVVIGGILSKTANQMQETWQIVARNVNEAINTSEEPLTEILSLSYRHLPHYLRPCFLYMGGFPEDYNINVSRLTKLWAAEGFLKPNRSKNPEEVAEEYVEDLTRRSLFMISKKKYDGKIKSVKIHDILRDLCLRKSQDEKFLQVIKKYPICFPEGFRNWRRLCSYPCVLHNFEGCEDSSVQTILLHFPGRELDSWKNFLLLRLRILDARGIWLESFPPEICNLFHLRFLAFTINIYGKVKIPQFLSKLRNLQTLMITGDATHLSLPREIWGMPQLSHLILTNALLSDPSTGVLSTLEKLSTLSRVKCFTCSGRILELLPNLKKLKIWYSTEDICENGWSNYCLNNLVGLQRLENLNLHVESDRCYTVDNRDLIALFKSHIAFPETMKKLTLSGCGIPWEDMTIIGSLPNLQVLKLKDLGFSGEHDWVTTEGEFCQLKVLEISYSNLRCWNTDSSHFPRLQRLLLHHCFNLIEIPECIGDVPTLELIEVICCCSSIEKSAKRIQEEQESLGNNLQIRLHLK